MKNEKILVINRTDYERGDCQSLIVVTEVTDKLIKKNGYRKQVFDNNNYHSFQSKHSDFEQFVFSFLFTYNRDAIQVALCIIFCFCVVFSSLLHLRIMHMNTEHINI